MEVTRLYPASLLSPGLIGQTQQDDLEMAASLPPGRDRGVESSGSHSYLGQSTKGLTLLPSLFLLSLIPLLFFFLNIWVC